MGQQIQIDDVKLIDDSIVISTDRNFTGTDGEGYDSKEAGVAADTFAAGLAVDLFEADDGLSRVWVSSNVVIIGRNGSWTDAAQSTVRRVIEDFYLFYPESSPSAV